MTFFNQIKMSENQNLSSDESGDKEQTFRNFDAETSLIIREDTLPNKSSDRYLLVYEVYQKWRFDHKKQLLVSEENNLIIYSKEMQQKLKPPTRI